MGRDAVRCGNARTFFSLSEKQVLLISPQEMEAEGLEFHNGSNTVFLIGTYDKETMQFTRECSVCWIMVLIFMLLRQCRQRITGEF